MKPDNNWLTYGFLDNLGSKYTRYFQKYSKDHNPFDNKKYIKHTFSSTMQYFQNTVHNLSSLEKPLIFMAAMLIMPNAAFISPNPPKSQTKILLGAQSGTSKAQVITLQKTVKYCIYCGRNYHTKNKCYNKYLYLKKAQALSAKLAIKWQRNRKPVKDNSTNLDLGKGSYFIQLEFGSFIATLANLLLANL